MPQTENTTPIPPAVRDKVIANLNPNPVLNFDLSAVYIGFKNGRSLSVALSRGRLPFLKQNITYVGSRAMFRQDTLEAYLSMRNASVLANRQQRR